MNRKLVGNLYNFVVNISPCIEVFCRKIYWRNIEKVSNLSNLKSERIDRTELLDFEDVINFLKKCGINKGDLVVMHSSYGNVKPCTLSATEIIDRLIDFLGEDGTLAAPVIRCFKEEGHLSLKQKYEDKIKDITCVYDVNETKITSGILGELLMRHEGSVTSLFPLNPMTAYGKLAKPMMEKNLYGEYPSAHGPNSSWKFCYDNDAYILYLGVDFGHHLTMHQIIAECNPTWNIKNFYVKRNFDIKYRNRIIKKTVSERRLFWSQFISEKNNRDEIYKSGIVKSIIIKGVPIHVIKSKDLIDFYLSRRNYYPYLFLSKKYINSNISYKKNLI